MKNFKVILFLGPPGSGKGTQAALLQEKFGFEYIGSGDLLRARTKIKDYTGKKIKQVIGSGKRLPTPVIFKIWMDKLEKFKKKRNLKGFIIDGSPRTVFEAEMLEQALEWYDWNKNKKVIFISLSTKEIIDRLTKRKRPDDNLQAIKIKLKWFKADVRPTIDYYKEKDTLVRINGEQSIENVARDILKAVRKK